MTPFQIGALCLLAVAVAWNYLPALSFRLPAMQPKPNTMRQIEQVLAIKESSTSPKVQEACHALLQALIS